jgi:stage V sporulation protein B
MTDQITEIAEDSAKGGFFLFAGQALSTFILALGSIAVSRILGPEVYGLYGLSLVAPSTFLLFTGFGIDLAIVRFSARLRVENENEKVAGLIRSALIFKSITGSLMSILCFVLSDFFALHALSRPEIAYLIRISALTIPFNALLSVSRSAFMGLDSMQDTALTINLQSIIKSASSPLLVLLGFGLAGAVLGQLLSVAIGGLITISILFLRHYRKLGGSSENNSISRNVKEMIGYAFPAYVSGLLTSLIGQYQGMILALLTSNIEIGNLRVATHFAALINVLIVPMSVLLSAFSKVDPKSENANKIFINSVKYTSLLIIPAAIFISLSSKNFINFIYGTEYEIAPLLLSIQSLIFLYAGIGSLVITHFLVGAGKTKTVLVANLINLVIFAPLAPWLVTLLGIQGVIIASLTSTLFSIIYQLIIVKREFHFNLDIKELSRIYLAAIIPVGPTYLFLSLSPFNDLLNVLIGGGIFLFTYLTLSPIIRSVTPVDLQNLTIIFSRFKEVWLFIKPMLIYEAKLSSLTRKQPEKEQMSE